MLLDRQNIPVLDAVGRLAGLQAQVASPPYVGLWTRLQNFRREELSRLMEERQVVRAALTRSMNSITGKRLDALDVGPVVAASREFFEEEPRTFADLRPLLSELEPERDQSALAYAVRTHLPLVQVPSGGVWGYSGKAPFTTAERWLGRPLSGSEEPQDLILAYLAAFGPATVRDVQTWSGRMQLEQPIEEMRPELRTFRDEPGNELFDLPDAPLPSGDIPAPARFVPDYDNLVLSHADRRRVISEEHRKKVFLSAARVRATFLIDGFVRGAWKVEKKRKTATLQIEPFEPLSKTLSENYSMKLERRRISPRMGLSTVTVLKGDTPYEQGYHV